MVQVFKASNNYKNFTNRHLIKVIWRFIVYLITLFCSILLISTKPSCLYFYVLHLFYLSSNHIHFFHRVRIIWDSCFYCISFLPRILNQPYSFSLIWDPTAENINSFCLLFLFRYYFLHILILLSRALLNVLNMYILSS